MSFDDAFLERQKIWVIGCKGLLGTQILRQMEAHNLEDIFVSDIDVDITRAYTLDVFVSRHPGIQWIINCAAYTNMDKAETDFENADALNNLGARNVARCAKKIGARLIHLSCDYVFDGKQGFPYTEESKINPINRYGKTKAAGEKAVLEEQEQSYILRTSCLYGPYGPNFVYSLVELMNKHKKIMLANDQFICPTFTGDISFAILTLISPYRYPNFPVKRPPYGFYNFADIGKTTWYDTGIEIYRLGIQYGQITKECHIYPCTSNDYKTIAPRLKYSILSTSKICDVLNLIIPTWEDSLDFFMQPEIYALRAKAETPF